MVCRRSLGNETLFTCAGYSIMLGIREGQLPDIGTTSSSLAILVLRWYRRARV